MTGSERPAGTPAVADEEDAVDQPAAGGFTGGGVSARTPGGGTAGGTFDSDLLGGEGQDRGMTGGTAVGDVLGEEAASRISPGTLGHDTVGVTPTGDLDSSSASGDLSQGTPTGEEGRLPIVETPAAADLGNVPPRALRDTSAKKPGSQG